MNWIDVVSAGPGNEDLLTAQARRTLDEADAVFCADRTQTLVGNPAVCRHLTPFSKALENMETLRAEGLRVAVLLSGDAGLYSMLPLLSERFGREALRVHPGVSSLQAFCARLGIPWQQARILSAHGKQLTPSALCHTVRSGRMTLLLLDAEHNPRWIRQSLKDGGLENAEITVGERISYPDECIGPWEDREYDPLSVALIENRTAGWTPRAFALPDDAFIRGKTPMTRREIRAQVAAELNLIPDAVIWDIGAGTGSVTVECALQCPFGRVYAVERDPDALKLIEENIRQFHLQNVDVVAGSAPKALENLPAPTHVFLGGTGGHAAEILALLENLDTPVRLCGTAVTLESIRVFFDLLQKKKNFSAVQIAVSRAELMGGYHMLRAQNPVFVFSADLCGE